MSDASRARRLLRPRWIAAHLAVAALVAVFVRLGIWQLDRAAEVRAVNEAIVARAALPVEPVESLAPLGTEATYRRAEVRGRYDTAREVILHSRSRNSIAGHHVLTPLVLRDGRAVVVDRGWVPFAMRVPPVPQARPPAGEVVVRGIVLPTQQRGRFGPVDPPAGTLEVV